MNIKIENLREPVAAIRPVYTDRGDGCQIITDYGGSYYDCRSIKAVKRALARSHGMDLTAQGKLVADRIGRSGILPFYLDNSRLFIPFKMRKPRAEGDHSYGYVRLDQAADIELGSGMPCIRLACGELLELNSSLITARHNLELGRRLAGMLKPPADEEELIVQAIRVILAWLKM